MRTVTRPADHVVVVGAGLAGLSAALHLRGAGREVTVVERSDTVGGRVGTYSLPGYEIDSGATVLTLPHLIAEALMAVGADPDALDIVKIEPAYQARYAGGRTIRVFSDQRDMENEIIGKVGAGRHLKGYRRLRRWLERVFNAEFESFMASNFDTPLDMIRTGKSRRDLAKLTFLGGFGKLENRIRRYVPDADLRRLYTFQALYAGLPPSKALSIYGAIPHMDTALGVYFPRGGMRQIAEVMSKAFVDAGGQLFTGTEVTEIEFTKSRATAVRTTGGRIECDALVVTTDLGELETLIPRRRRFPRRLHASPSCVVIHGSVPVAIAAQMPIQAHHTIEFGAEWSRTFSEICAPDGLGRLMTDPSLLLTRPALTDPSMRFMRHGQLQEPLSILAPCPNLDSAPLDWDALTESYVQDLLATLESRGYPWLRSEFRIDRVDTPATWKAAGMLAGSPFSAAHLFRQTGPFRTRNLLRRTDNIVLAGCGTTPGVGVPTVLLSGKLAAQRMGAETSR